MSFLPVVASVSFVVVSIHIVFDFERAKMKTLKARLDEAQGKIQLLTEQNNNLQQQVVERQGTIEHLASVVDEMTVSAAQVERINNNQIQTINDQLHQIEDAYGKCFTLLEKVGSEKLTLFQVLSLLSGIARKSPGLLVQASEAISNNLYPDFCYRAEK